MVAMKRSETLTLGGWNPYRGWRICEWAVTSLGGVQVASIMGLREQAGLRRLLVFYLPEGAQAMRQGSQPYKRAWD